jgi:hypothetical protein
LETKYPLFIIGCGYTGTKFYSKVFDIEHEGEGIRQSNSMLRHKIEGVREKHPKAVILHSVRHPISWVQSNLRRVGNDPDRIEDIAKEWVEGNKMVRPYANGVLKLEDMPESDINAKDGEKRDLTREEEERIMEICGEEAKHYYK